MVDPAPIRLTSLQRTYELDEELELLEDASCASELVDMNVQQKASIAFRTARWSMLRCMTAHDARDGAAAAPDAGVRTGCPSADIHVDQPLAQLASRGSPSSSIQS